MKKRVISLILALVMVIGILPVNVLAAEPAEQVQTPQAVTIETSLDGELTDGVFTTAEEPLDVKIRAAADGETVEHTAKLDGEVLEGTPEEDGWTTYVLSFAQSGSYTLDISAADEEQSRTIVYQAQDTQDGEQDVQEPQEDPADKSSDEPMDEVLSEDTEETSTLEEAADALFEERSGDAAEQEVNTEDETDTNLGAEKGSVRVIVENNAAAPAPASYGYGVWADGATQWSGELVDKTVALYEKSTIGSCIVDALEGYSVTGAMTGYVTEVNGLKADQTNYSAGWMVTLNDWFTSTGISDYTVAAGNLNDGDEICLFYTCSFGKNEGSILNDTNKKLTALSVTGATLNPSFSSATNAYELVIGEKESASITLTPTAANKNFLACIFNQEMSAAEIEALDNTSWFSYQTLVRRGQSISVKPGDKLTVVVGAQNWPSMNNETQYGGAKNVEPCVYTLEVVKTGTDHSATFDDFFPAAVKAAAEIRNDETYPFVVQNGVLKSTNEGIDKSDAAITFTFKKAVELGFSYKASCEGYSYGYGDYLEIRIKKAGDKSYKPDKQDGGKNVTDFTKYAVEMQEGDSLQLAYKKDMSAKGGDDCVYLKDFMVTLPNAVTFHANDGTDVTSKQDIFGTANLTKNTFTREGYRFDGWAATAGGEVRYADGAEITLTQNVDLYAVWTKVWNVTFPHMQAGAAITVKQNGEALPVSATANTWIVPNGSYTYSAELFGYVSKTDVAFEVKDADYAVSESLDSAARTNVTFAVGGVTEGTEVTITVLNSENTRMEPTQDGGKTYALPAGKYTYTVAAQGYKKLKNQPLTVEVGQTERTVSVTLEVSAAWDGKAVTTPAQMNGVYQIGSGAELAGFAKLVNDGETGAKGVLTADIVLNDDGEFVHQWTPIANTSSAPFTGSLNGNGRIISGLYIDSKETAVGLFGYVGNGGEISNVTIEGASVKSTSSSGAYAALAVASNAGSISNVKLENSMVSGGFIVGGVVGLNDGTVTGCANESATVEQNTAKDQGVGGIVGQNNAAVSLSYNKAHIVRGHDKTSYSYLGGIVGNNSGGSAVVENSYNQGEVDIAYYVGGIVGKANGKITNCYNTGSIPSKKSAIVGYNASAKITNCYFLDTCGAKDNKGTSKTAEEFKTLAASLGGAYENTDAYPILKWQNPNATYTITLTVKPARANVTLSNGGGALHSEKTEDTEKDEATYTYTSLNKGNYTWSVSCGDGEDDYQAQSSTISLGVADETRRVELAAKEYTVTFQLTPAEAELTLTQGEGESAVTVMPKTPKDENGKVVYSLTKGSYNYKATAFGYDDASATLEVLKGTGLAAQNIALTAKTGSTLTFTNVPEGATVTVTHAEGGVQNQTSNENGTVVYTLVPETYSYRVKRKGFKAMSGTVTMSGSPESIAVTLSPLGKWDGTVGTAFGGSGTKDDPYQIESGEELAYLSKLVADGVDTSGIYYKLTEDIDLNNIAFTPIGTTTSLQFKGSFNGAGNTISNLKVENNVSLTGLFGRVNAATISDLTIDHATISSTSGIYTGVLAGAVYGSSNITNCVVKYSTVTGKGNYTGGLVGYSGADISRCAVIDTTVNGTAYVGGMFGQGKKVTECYVLRGTVTASGNYAGGLLGSGSAQVENCFVRSVTVTASTGYAGGIIGNGSAKVKNTYAVADVSSESGSYGSLGGSSTVTVSNAFYCKDSTITGSGTSYLTGTGKTTAELKSDAIATSLGAAFARYTADDGYINAGFPYLVNAPRMEKINPEQLAQPVITWSGKTVSWSEIANAQGYAVVLTKDGKTVDERTVTQTSVDYTTEIDLAGSGTYTVQVTALGDGEYYTNSSATAQSEITVNSASVTISVVRADGEAFAENNQPVITLTMADGTTTIAFANGETKPLPLGQYTYTVKAKTFGTLNGSFELTAEGKTLNLTMAYSAVWDGETTLEPSQDNDGTYLISNSYELAWFRDQVNDQLTNGYTSCMLNAKLTENIDLGSHDWTAIAKVTGTSESKGYAGTFNGDGHTISNLKPVGSEVTSYNNTKIQGAGLFGYVYVGGTVQNVTVSGTLNAVQYSGGVVAILAGGTVENCVSSMHVTSELSTNVFAGGIVGNINSKGTAPRVIGCRNDGIIEGGTNSYVGGITGQVSNRAALISNCTNTAAVSGKERIGGIVGSSNAAITACWNTGSVTGTSDEIGGIAGFSSGDTRNCYNSGDVAGVGKTNGVGGIVGRLQSENGGKVTGCLVSGSVTASGEYFGAIVGSKGGTSSVITRSYYLNTSSTKAIGSNAAETDETTPVTADELGAKRLIGLLGGAFASGSDGKLVLNWQDAQSKPVVSFVVPDGATVTVTGQSAAANEPGVYVLTDGTYTYTVSKTGCNAKTDEFTVSGESQSIEVSLEAETFQVTFNVQPDGAKIVVRSEAGEEVAPTQESASIYSLPNGKYTYTVSKLGCMSRSGEFTVNGAAVVIPAITLTGATLYTVTLSFQDEDKQSVTPTSVTVKFDGETVDPAEGTFTYSLPNGTYTCLVDDSRYYKVEERFTVEDANRTITVSLETNRSWDGKSTTEVTPNADGVYEIKTAAELAWFAAQVNAGNTGYNAKLMANIYVNYNGSTNVWTPIGGFKNQYAGTFDGNGKRIYGLTAALFSYNAAKSLVKNLTVYGENVAAEANTGTMGGICNSAYGSFENCVSRMTVTATWSVVGGIVGRLYAGGSITNCANYGTVSTSHTASSVGISGVYNYSYVGGIVGQSYGAVTGCFNAGSVASPNTNYGGVGGIAGVLQNTTVMECYNTGAVTGYMRTGGIIGAITSATATSATATVKNCYDTGKITLTSDAYNPFGGAIAGSIADSDGVLVGSVENCYYLTGSRLYNGQDCGIGYAGTEGSDTTVSKLESEMKLDAFALALSPTDKHFNVDSENNNGGFPVLTWQGGRLPEASEDEKDVAADKAELTVEPTTVTSAMQLTLASSGRNGSTITWSSSNTGVIANDGTVTLPLENDVKVTLTATITKNNVTDTKQFQILVKTRASADAAALRAILEKLPTSYRVAYQQTPVNVTSALKAKLADAIAKSGVSGLTADDITVTLKSAGTVSYGSDTNPIAQDGAVTFYYQDPATCYINGDLTVREVVFQLTTDSGAKAETASCMVAIPWDQARVKAAMLEAAKALTFDTIKNKNTDAESVSTDLTLPQQLPNYGWSLIGWSSDSNVIQVTGGSGVTAFTGVVSAAENDTNVKLTATFTFNRNNIDEDGDITVTKEIPVKVPGKSNGYMTEINSALEKFTLDSLTYMRGEHKGERIDPNAVTDNIQLPKRALNNIDAGRNGYALVYEARNADETIATCPVSVNSYAAYVSRPLAEESVEVILKLTITKKENGVLNETYKNSKELRIKISPIKPSDIDAEIALLDQVKANLFVGINDDRNVAKEAVTQDLHAFREGYLDADGKLVWIYDEKNDKGVGIVPTDLPGYDSMSGANWRLFRSSNEAVITCENLLVTPDAKDDKTITITANLKSARFGGYYEAYKDNAAYSSVLTKLQRLAGELVAVDVTVISTANQTAAAATVAKIDAIGNVTKDSGTKITGARDAYSALTDGAKKLVSNLQTLIDAEEAFKNLSGGDSEADKKAADDVIAKIDEIGAIGKDSGAKITEAENAYNELNDAAKGLVGDANYKKLTDAKAAQTVYDQIEALFPVSADSKNAIAQAEAAYKNLNTEAKALLPNAESRLEQAWKEYQAAAAAADQEQKDKAAAEKVDQLIDAIGEVTLEKENQITKARSEYEKLNTAATGYVKKLGVLEAAEAKLNELKNDQGYVNQLNNVLTYIKGAVDAPAAAADTKAEWAVLSAARAGCDTTAYKTWYAAYADNLAKMLKQNGGTFSTTNEYVRIVLALTALGQDAKSFAANGTTYDLVTPLTEKSGSTYKATVPGTTSTAFAIIALDSHPYSVTDSNAVSAMVADLLAKQHASGAWAINAKYPDDDVDTTAMILMALAPHKSEAGVQAAIEKAVSYLAEVQGTSGYGNTNTDAQVVTALSALGIDCTKGEFVKGSGNPLTGLLSHQMSSGGFKYAESSVSENQLATEQAAYALVAYDRFKCGQNPLYRMSDAQDLLPKDTSAEEVIDLIDKLGTVTDCSRSTYLKIQEIASAYDRLTDAQKKDVSNYDTFLRQKAKFQTLLEEYRAACLKELENYYNKLNRSDYTTTQWNKITEAYRNGRASISSAQYAEQADAALRQAKEDIAAYATGDTIEVTFRLIGDFPESYTNDHLGYVNWIETESYTLKTGSTVYDLFSNALKDAGLSSTGTKDYISGITAPDMLGGYTLSEFSNGPASGWMFTVNGSHGNYAASEHVLKDGDRVVWHYVDNYATEEKAFTWLEAEDITPSEYVHRHISDVATAGKNGSVEPRLTTSDLGGTVKFTFKPDAGYHVKDVKVDGKSIGAVDSYTYKGLKIYSRITVEFTNGSMPFTDVNSRDWFYDDVEYVYNAGLFAGTTATTFSPKASMTRAMLVTVLYRLEGEPSVTGTSAFDDVVRGAYYEDAVIWAAKHEIVNGVSNTQFSPNTNVSREQMAAILYRYAQYKSYRTSATTSLKGFYDANTASGYAVTPMQWAVAEKLVNGSNGSLLPRGNATRAQVAAILHRFVENVVK